jgi:hypothetical protein
LQGFRRCGGRRATAVRGQVQTDLQTAGRRTIPHRKEGSRLLFKLSHLDAWIEGGGAA